MFANKYQQIWLLDAGNTSIKLGQVLGKNILSKGRFFSVEDIEIDANAFVLMLSVGRFTETIKEFLATKSISYWELNKYTPLPFVTKYKSENTLGLDRKALIAGTQQEWPNSIVISMGSCITYDLLSNKEHLGGNITPGWQMRLHAMHQNTAKLPLLTPKTSEIIFGDDTDSAMQFGVFNGILAEIDFFIYHAKQQISDCAVIITGSDANSFENKIKNKIFAPQNLIFKGLRNIFEYNEQL